MEEYIADDRLVLKIQGLRFAAVEDSSMGRYYLLLNYKGTERRFDYEDKGTRDAIFGRICEALTQKGTYPPIASSFSISPVKEK